MKLWSIIIGLLVFTGVSVSAQSPQFSNQTVSAGLGGITFVPGVWYSGAEKYEAPLFSLARYMTPLLEPAGAFHSSSSSKSSY